MCNRMHLHNAELGQNKSPDYVSRFGFSVPTCCGEIAQGNKWESSWSVYYTNKLQEQMGRVKADKEAQDLWAKLKDEIPSMFDGLGDIEPALMHGDLWSGNVAQTQGEPGLSVLIIKVSQQ